MFFLFIYRQKDMDKNNKGKWPKLIDKLTCEIMENKPLGPVCSFYDFYELYIFQ